MEILRTLAHNLQRVFGPELEALGDRTGVIQRRRKFGAMTLLRTLVLTVLKHPRAQPADFQRTAAQVGVHVSKAAIVRRYSDPLIAFLREVLEYALKHALEGRPAASALFQGFTAVFIGDASTVALPDDYAEQFPGCGGAARSGRAALKLQLLWDFLAGAWRRLAIEPGKSGDAVSPIAREQLPAGSLSLFDLGYFDLERFRRLMQGGAFWISRLQLGVTVSDSDGRELSLLDFLQGRLDAGQRMIDMPILLGATHRLACRLIAVRIPQEVASRRRQQAHEKAAKHGRAASVAYLRWQDWTIFVTNCEPERLTWKAVVILYRVRWQIELMFKLWKSHNGLAQHRPEASAPERLALIYAKLIGVVVQHWILVTATWNCSRHSLMKAAATVREWITNLAEHLDNPERLVETLGRLATTLEGDCVERRQKQPSLFQLLEDPELLDWQT
ncbi:MAG: IS4 family transposase [Isosphaerales bacterium]